MYSIMDHNRESYILYYNLSIWSQSRTICYALSPGIAVHLKCLSRGVGATVVQTGTEVLLDTASFAVGP